MGWSASGLLDTCERGHMQGPVAARTLVLLSSRYAEPSSGWDALNLGDMTRSLLDLYESSFGSRLEAVADCPGCGSRLEMSFTVDDVRGSFRAVSPPGSDRLHRVLLDDYEVMARDLTVGDLRAASSCQTVEAARWALIERCVVSSRRLGRAVGLGELPETVLRAVSDCLGEAEPAGDPRVSLACPDCGQQWDQGLDVTGHLWVELQSAAGRLQREVALLARSLGWSETEILALSPWRRRSYLALIGESE